MTLFSLTLILTAYQTESTAVDESPALELYGEVELVEAYPSDPTLFVQGLEQSEGGDLLVSTGLYGESKLGIIHLADGSFSEIDTLAEEYFGEGITQTEDYLWQVSWKENTAFKRNKENYEVIETVPYKGEGWGLAYNDDEQLIYMSDGSNQIQVRDPESFELIRTFEVKAEEEDLSDLNELEYADGYLYSNIWYEDSIIKIDPENGAVQTVYDIGPIIEDLDLSANQLEQMDSLNGIAQTEDETFYITGKLYPFILEVKLE